MSLKFRKRAKIVIGIIKLAAIVIVKSLGPKASIIKAYKPITVRIAAYYSLKFRLAATKF